jgi:hypothetical protein
MAQMPGHLAQAAQAARMHCPASLAIRSPRAVPGVLVSSRVTAPRSRSRHLRFCPADAATSADTANSPASYAVTMFILPARESEADHGDKIGRSARPLVVKDSRYTHERRLKNHGKRASMAQLFYLGLIPTTETLFSDHTSQISHLTVQRACS